MREESKILHENLRDEKEWGAKKMLNEIPANWWHRSYLQRLFKQ